MKRVVVRPAAAADIEDAYQWYESQQLGLGDEFLAALRSTRDRIAEVRDQHEDREGAGLTIPPSLLLRAHRVIE